MIINGRPDAAPTIRVYQPKQAMLDGHTKDNLVVQAGTYQIPPIQKISH